MKSYALFWTKIEKNDAISRVMKHEKAWYPCHLHISTLYTRHSAPLQSNCPKIRALTLKYANGFSGVNCTVWFAIAQPLPAPNSACKTTETKTFKWITLRTIKGVHNYIFYRTHKIFNLKCFVWVVILLHNIVNEHIY